MRPKIPHVTKFGDSPARLVFRTNVIIFFGSRINVFEKKIDFTGLKSSQFYFEIQIKKTLQFNRKNLLIPAGLLRKSIVCDYVCALFCFAEMFDLKCRYRVKAKQSCAADAAVATNYFVIAID